MMRKNLQCLAVCFVCILGGIANARAQERCGSMEVLNTAFKKNPALKASFDLQSQNLLQAIKERKAQLQLLRTESTTVYIPIVFHIVLTNPSQVTDAQVQDQLDQLNTDFAGLNADSTLIPSGFKSLFAKSNIQFKLAQRNPNDESATGIERITTSISQFDIDDDRVKYTASGGADAWDPDRFFNVWITNLSQGYLGYATFPGNLPEEEQGVVIEYNSLPGDNTPNNNYDKGRTLVHETGHYFYLYHIWGDENGCSGTDEVDDTPNQGTYTTGCPSSSVKTDNCTTSSPGIMYENYMDYTDDACMVMYTHDQKDRMETALSVYRGSLLTSNGADPVATYNLDAYAKSITSPLQRICDATFSPVITLRNTGSQTLTTVTINASIDNGAVSTTTWTGSLAYLKETSVTLNDLTVSTEGTHELKVELSSPNGSTDENAANDIITLTFQYYLPLTPPLTQGFENTTYPPVGWDIINPDLSNTWERTLSAAKTGSASVVMHNFNYQANGEKDYLSLPLMNITSADSAFMTFQVAAAVASNPSITGITFDTLQVLVSKDCGVTYTSLYKKWGSELITRSTAVTSSYTPAAGEWRKDSVNLSAYINGGPIMLAFVNTNENGNNIYLDDINIYSVTINPVLKSKGFIITPNPTTGSITVLFYPNPAFVKGINIFSSTGQLVASQRINGAGSSSYSFDLSMFASGVYVVQVVLGDSVITQKVIKR